MKEDAPQREFASRELFNALRWFVRAGCPGWMLPNNLPPWTAVQQQAQRWRCAGSFETIVHDLRAETRAQAELNIVAAELARRYPEANADHSICAELLLHFQVGHYERGLDLLLAAAACELLIACANVASLQMTRTLARARELAIRAAFGASQRSLIQQLLTESAWHVPGLWSLANLRCDGTQRGNSS